jgi:WD40 repeat protein
MPMNESLPIIDYGRKSKRRWAKWLIALALVVSLSLVGWRYGASIGASVSDAYADWRYARQFDTATRSLTKDGGPWRGAEGDISADQHLRLLLALGPPRIAIYLSTRPNTVIFVRAGQTGGRQWLVFGCVNQTGLEVYTFDRGERSATSYHRPYATPDFWQHIPKPRGHPVTGAPDVQAYGDTFSTTFTLDGGRNTIDWTIAGAVTRPVTGSLQRGPAPVMTTATPSTGWVSSNNWWPNSGEVTLLDGPGPSRVLAAINDSLAVSFVPDGRVALAAPARMAILGLDSTTGVMEHNLPAADRRRERAVFSPDGRWCFLGGTDEPAFVVGTLTGSVQPIGDTADVAHLSFRDSDTLVVCDNTSLREINCVTGSTTPLPMPAPYLSSMCAAGRLTAFTTGSSGEVRTISQDNAPAATFESAPWPRQMSLSPDGSWLVLKGQNGISIYDANSGQAIWRQDGNNDLLTPSSRIKWTADGSRGAAAGSRYVYVWSLKKPYWVARFPHGHAGFWPDVALSPDGRQMVACASGPATIAYWPDVDAALKLTPVPGGD